MPSKGAPPDDDLTLPTRVRNSPSASFTHNPKGRPKRDPMQGKGEQILEVSSSTLLVADLFGERRFRLEGIDDSQEELKEDHS
jgi:hypothetical protein